MNDVYKRKRSEIKRSDTEITKSDNLNYLRSKNKVTNFLSEITTLIKTLKKIIEQ